MVTKKSKAKWFVLALIAIILVYMIVSFVLSPFCTLSLILDFIDDGSKHFWLALLTGYLGWRLTSIIFSATCSNLLRSTRNWVSTVAGFCIHYCPLLAGAAAVYWSHYWLDYVFSVWYNTPMYPPLNLIVP